MSLAALACRLGWRTHRVTAWPTKYIDGRMTLTRICSRCGKTLGSHTYDRRQFRG